MASSGAGEQYIGSKIWLISKAEIRYEGILHSIDPNESTLALASVRSYGTEDRPAERMIAPREEVFELILFRASDIKDIRLCDTPKPAPPPPERTAPYDPAIIQVQSSAPGSFPPGGLHHPGAIAPHIRPGAFMVPPYPGYGGAFGPGTGLGQNLMPPVPAPTIGQSTITFSGIGTDLGPVGPPPHPDGPSEEESALLSGPKSDASTPLPPSEPDVGSRKVSESEGKVDEAVAARAGGHGQRREDYRRPNRGHYDNRNYQQRDYDDNRRGAYRGGRGGYEHRGGRGGHESRGGRGGHRDQGRDVTQTSAAAKPAGGSKLKFDQDYDFERANQDFERVMQQLSKTKISDAPATKAVSTDSVTENGDLDGDATNEERPKPVVEQQCYNKTKSFFDTISCEALERSKGGYQRPDWQKERQLNVETFGLKPRGAGGYRGGYNNNYGYRGYNRGNNYRNNYNRDGGYYRDNRDGYNRDYRDGGYGYRGGYRSNSGGYGGYENRGRGRGEGNRGGYRGGRGGRNYEEHDDRTERTDKPEGRSERGRGSYASRV